MRMELILPKKDRHEGDNYYENMFPKCNKQLFNFFNVDE